MSDYVCGNTTEINTTKIKTQAAPSGKDRLDQFVRARALFSLDLMIHHCKRLDLLFREHRLKNNQEQPLDTQGFDATDSCLVCYWMNGEGHTLFGLYRSYAALVTSHQHYHDLVLDFRTAQKQAADPAQSHNLQTQLHQALKQTTEQLRHLRALA